MAYGYANVSAAELSNLALDKPLFGANVIPKLPTTERWNDAGTTSDASLTATGYPAFRVHDGEAGPLVTKPNTTGTTWYFVWDLGTTVTVDFAALGPGHNLGTCALTELSLEFDQNQNGAFSAVDTCALVGSYPMASNARLTQFDLDPAAVGTPQRFSDVRFVRLKMVAAAPFTPEISEFIIGARLQMPRFPSIGFNPTNIGDIGDVGDPTIGGVYDSSIDTQNQFRLDAAWTIKQSEIASIKTWWQRSQGTLLWCWAPSTAPNDWHLMVRESMRLDTPAEGYTKHTFEIQAAEQGPESAYLGDL